MIGSQLATQQVQIVTSLYRKFSVTPFRMHLSARVTACSSHVDTYTFFATLPLARASSDRRSENKATLSQSLGKVEHNVDCLPQKIVARHVFSCEKNCTQFLLHIPFRY